jgi:inosine-uridine nucleoside N-ribohydrolase
VRDAVRFYVGFHQRAEGIDGAYLHDPVTLIGALLRPDLVTETVRERLACDTGADLYAAGSLYRSEADSRPEVEIAVAIDGEAMKAELLSRLTRAVSVPYD